mmetsp:Transcript_57292/g.121821  ORF Transcript_57292/g.121821 Transcript_57292/m.121821 type:complete len:318 (-) Transcript_57292:281-1234(-)
MVTATVLFDVFLATGAALYTEAHDLLFLGVCRKGFAVFCIPAMFTDEAHHCVEAKIAQADAVWLGAVDLHGGREELVTLKSLSPLPKTLVAGRFFRGEADFIPQDFADARGRGRRGGGSSGISISGKAAQEALALHIWTALELGLHPLDPALLAGASLLLCEAIAVGAAAAILEKHQAVVVADAADWTVVHQVASRSQVLLLPPLKRFLGLGSKCSTANEIGMLCFRHLVNQRFGVNANTATWINTSETSHTLGLHVLQLSMSLFLPAIRTSIVVAHTVGQELLAGTVAGRAGVEKEEFVGLVWIVLLHDVVAEVLH